jgi:hypothetical protein
MVSVPNSCGPARGSNPYVPLSWPSPCACWTPCVVWTEEGSLYPWLLEPLGCWALPKRQQLSPRVRACLSPHLAQKLFGKGCSTLTPFSPSLRNHREGQPFPHWTIVRPGSWCCRQPAVLTGRRVQRTLTQKEIMYVSGAGRGFINKTVLHTTCKLLSMAVFFTTPRPDHPQNW